MLRIASPTKNTAANNAASGKNLAITNPTPRNTEEITMAARSVPTGGLNCHTHTMTKSRLNRGRPSTNRPNKKPRRWQGQGLKDASAYLV